MAGTSEEEREPADAAIIVVQAWAQEEKSMVLIDGELLAAESKYVVTNTTQSRKVKNWKPPK
jgi:hypothetical protein